MRPAETMHMNELLQPCLEALLCLCRPVTLLAPHMSPDKLAVVSAHVAAPAYGNLEMSRFELDMVLHKILPNRQLPLPIIN